MHLKVSGMRQTDIQRVKWFCLNIKQEMEINNDQ